MNYSPIDINQGNQLRKMAEETPSNFGLIDGASEQPVSTKSDRRMAGPVGSRAIALMTDPNEQARTQNWMAKFGMSNEGMQFNQARMMMANPQPQQEEA